MYLQNRLAESLVLHPQSGFGMNSDYISDDLLIPNIQKSLQFHIKCSWAV